MADTPIAYPSWHPGGDLVFYEWTPLLRTEFPNGTECSGMQIFDYSRTGYYASTLTGQVSSRLLPWLVFSATWSPTGDTMAFENDGEVFSVSFDGASFDTTGVVQLTYGGSNFYPAWSPDGTKVAYWRFVVCPNPATDDSTACGVLTMSPSGGNKKGVVNGSFPSWFPDSRRVLYVGLEENLFAIDTLDSSIVQLTNYASQDQIHHEYCALSPDGNWVGYSSSRNGVTSIWVMESDGTGARHVTNGGVLPLFCWSPDSKFIAYVNYQWNNWSDNSGVLWRIDVATGVRTIIATGRS